MPHNLGRIEVIDYETYKSTQNPEKDGSLVESRKTGRCRGTNHIFSGLFSGFNAYRISNIDQVFRFI